MDNEFMDYVETIDDVEVLKRIIQKLKDRLSIANSRIQALEIEQKHLLSSTYENEGLIKAQNRYIELLETRFNILKHTK